MRGVCAVSAKALARSAASTNRLRRHQRRQDRVPGRNAVGRSGRAQTYPGADNLCSEAPNSPCALLRSALRYSSLERDFCRRRQAPQKGPEVDVSAQRPEIGDYHAREMAAKAAFLAASYQLRVLEAASLSGYLIAWPRRARQHPERVATIHRGDPPHDQSTNLLSCSADET